MGHKGEQSLIFLELYDASIEAAVIGEKAGVGMK